KRLLAGLKIPREETPVPVRVRPSAPKYRKYYLNLRQHTSTTMSPDNRKGTQRGHTGGTGRSWCRKTCADGGRETLKGAPTSWAPCPPPAPRTPPSGSPPQTIRTGLLCSATALLCWRAATGVSRLRPLREADQIAMRETTLNSTGGTRWRTSISNRVRK